jgi:hypothetical protein
LYERNNESNLEGVKDGGSKFERKKKEKKTNRSEERKKRRKESFLLAFATIDIIHLIISFYK